MQGDGTARVLQPCSCTPQVFRYPSHLYLKKQNPSLLPCKPGLCSYTDYTMGWLPMTALQHPGQESPHELCWTPLASSCCHFHMYHDSSDPSGNLSFSQVFPFCQWKCGTWHEIPLWDQRSISTKQVWSQRASGGSGWTAVNCYCKWGLSPFVPTVWWMRLYITAASKVYIFIKRLAVPAGPGKMKRAFCFPGPFSPLTSSPWFLYSA